jgi:3-hydroxyisobutyrate dehydrogenase-like beta-hydroxyacid dehydrogenase
MRIGFIGAGSDGAWHGAQLAERRPRGSVIAPPQPGAHRGLLAKGAEEAASLDKIAHTSDCIILCLSSSKIVEETVAA